MVYPRRNQHTFAGVGIQPNVDFSGDHCIVNSQGSFSSGDKVLGDVATIQDVQLAPIVVTDVININQNLIQIVPQPAGDFAKITTGKLPIDAIEVFDMTGRSCEVFHSLFPMGAILNTSKLSNGFYMVQLVSGNQVYYSKLMVE